jgi:PilZ domain
MRSSTAESVMTPESNRERQFPRYDHCRTIQYVLTDHSTTEVFLGVTRNISLGGICLYMDRPLKEGQRVQIISKLPMGSPMAALRWIEEENSLYVAGLMFVDDEEKTTLPTT